MENKEINILIQNLRKVLTEQELKIDDTTTDLSFNYKVFIQKTLQSLQYIR